MIPILVAQVSTAGITFINTTMAGHAGADDLAGVSVGAGLFYPILASIIGLLMAGTPMMAQLLGQKKKEDLPLIVRTGLMIGLFISAVFAAGYFLFVDNLMEYLALEPAVEHIARGYLLSMVGVVTFVTLIKSSCKSVDEVLRQTKNAGDERSTFIIKNIFQPVYKRYIEELTNINQIDFTDAILQATDICRSSHPVKYDYIIVDEFQDISVDRYNFLKVLREGNPPAKLYCVGDDWQSIYRFSGSDMALFNQFSDYFGQTEINKIETTYRFGEPLVSLSSQFIQRNEAQIKKNIHPFNPQVKTELQFCDYERRDYCNVIGQLVASIPLDKSVFLLGRYSFDDYYLSFMYKSVKEGNRFFYISGDRKIEFLTVHKSKGLEADYVIILQCNKDTYGFPSLVSDDPVLNYVLTKSDQYPYGEERRLFYVAITRAKVKTYILYDKRFPSVFVDEFLHPEKVTEESYAKYPNANKKWTRSADNFLLTLYHERKSIKYIAEKMGRSQTSIVMRLGKLEGKRQ